jgi:hypothetical protein
LGLAFGPETGCTIGSLVRVTAPAETDSRGRNALSWRWLLGDAAKLERWWAIRAM